MGALIKIIENEMLVSHVTVAENTENDEVSIKRLLTTHKGDFEEFGALRFEIVSRKDGNKGGKQPRIYNLNEQQWTLLLTYLKNTKVVRQFKKQIVKEFYEMRERLYQKPNSVLEDIIMAQNATIANQQRQLESKKIEEKPKKHPKSGLNPVDHNTLLELIYQFSVYKQNLRMRIMADLDTEGNIENFLIGVGNRYPELKEYIDKHSENMEHLQLHFNGMTPNWDKVKKIAEGL